MGCSLRSDVLRLYVCSVLAWGSEGKPSGLSFQKVTDSSEVTYQCSDFMLMEFQALDKSSRQSSFTLHYPMCAEACVSLMWDFPGVFEQHDRCRKSLFGQVLLVSLLSLKAGCSMIQRKNLKCKSIQWDFHWYRRCSPITEMPESTSFHSQPWSLFRQPVLRENNQKGRIWKQFKTTHVDIYW